MGRPWSPVSYEAKVNSITVQGERPRAGARQDGGTVKGGAVIIGEAQGGDGSGQTVKLSDVLERSPGQV